MLKVNFNCFEINLVRSIMCENCEHEREFRKDENYLNVYMSEKSATRLKLSIVTPLYNFSNNGLIKEYDCVEMNCKGTKCLVKTNVGDIFRKKTLKILEKH